MPGTTLKYKFTGGETFDDVMRLLGQRVSSQESRKALNTAILPLTNDMRKTAPLGTEPHWTHRGRKVMPGFLRRNVKRKSKAGKRAPVAWANVVFESEAWYGKLINMKITRIRKRPPQVKAASRQKFYKGGINQGQLDKLGDKRTKRENKHVGWINDAYRRHRSEMVTIYSAQMKKNLRKAAKR